MCTYVGLHPPSILPIVEEHFHTLEGERRVFDRWEREGEERKMKDVSKFSNESIRKFLIEEEKEFRDLNAGRNL